MWTVYELIKVIEEMSEPSEGSVFVQLPENCRWKHIWFDSIYGEHSWSLTPRYSITGSVTNVYPMQSTNNVKHFKTFAGCKRSIVKYIEEVSKHSNIFREG